MARTGLPKLELDDPLRARTTPAEQPPRRKQTSTAKSPRPAPKQPPSTPSPPATEHTTEAGNAPWRKWGTGSRTATYRLPEGILDELDERARILNLPLGLTIAAAVLLLLDEDDRTVIRHVDRVEDARRAAQRAARPVPAASRSAPTQADEP